MRPFASRPVPLVALVLVAACAGSRGAAPMNDEDAEGALRGCAQEMPPARDIETYAGVIEPLAPAGLSAAPLLASSLDRAPIIAVVRAHRPELRACYEQGLARNPNLEGTIAVRWSIASDTTVKDVELAETTLADPCVVRCVMDEIATWSFPGFRGLRSDIRLVYPFLFTAYSRP